MTQRFIRYTLCIICTLLCSINIWGNSSAKVTVISEPSNGGQVSVNSSNSAGFYGTTISSQQTTGSKWTLETKKKFTFYRFQNTNNNYVFKGWATSNATNSGDTQSSVTVTGSSLSSDYPETKYYAIFARMTADKSSLAYDATKVGQSAQQTITITHAHAGKITANISDDNAGDYTVSSTTPVATSVSEGTQDITVTFAPTCNGTRTATLTLHSDNGLSDVVISLTGEGVLNEQTLTWGNEPIDPNMTLGSTLSISATATSGLDVTYTSSDPEVISVSGNTLTANKVGTAVITASQTGNCTFAAAESITKTFTVNDKATPTFWLNNDPSQTEADLKVGESITINIENTSEALQSEYNTDYLSIASAEGIITVTATGATESATLTLTQPETAAIFGVSRTFTFHITKNTATLTNNLVAEYLVDDEIAFTDLYTATNDEVAVIVLSSDETVLKADGDKLVAVGAGTAEITVSQAENYKWTALSETKTVTVNKHANTIVWSFAGVETTSKTLSYDEIVAVAYTSGNADTEGSPITIIQTAGEGIAAYNAEQHTITASYHNGTATWTISQPEDRKFLAAEATITVTVAALQSGCDIINNSEEFDVPWNSTKGETTWNDINAAAQLTFEAKMQLWSTGDMEIEAYINGNWTKIQSIGTGSLSNDSYNTFSYELAAEVQGIRFKNAGTLSRYVKNVRISRRQHLTPSATKLTLPPIKLGNQDSVRFSLQWSTCADAIKLVSSNSYFKLNKTEIPTTGAGMADITLTYTSNEVETATSTITIYTPYQNITLEATGKTKKRDQKLSWTEPWKDIAEPAISIGREIKNPVESSVDGWIAAYTSSDPTVIDIEGVTLKALKAGTATITAYHPGNEEWASASTEKTFHVTGKRVQRIVWNQNLTKLNITDNTCELTAQVFTEDANGEFAFNADRTARLSYSSGNEEVVSVSDNMLTIHAVGETMLTAIVEGDDFYEEAQSSMPVRVRDNMAECPDYWVATDYNGEYEFFKLDIARPAIEKQYSIDRTTGIPDILTFQHRGSKWGPYYKGNIEVYESADGGGTWNKLETVSPKVGTEYQETSVALSHEATHIKFVRPQGGEGYHYIKNISIEPASFVESPSTVIDFGTMQVGSTEERTFIISYSGIKSSLAISIGDTENEESESSSNAVEPFVLSTTTIGECGKWGSEPIILSFTPNVSQVGELHSFVVVTEPVSKMSLRIPIEATITPNNHFTFTGGDTGSDEWGNGTNWSGKSIPTDDDEVIVAADVVITGDVSVAGLTINPDRTVKVQGKLTIGTEPSNDLSSYGNLIIENGGEVVLGKGVLKVKDFIINASTGSMSDQQPLSGSAYERATSGQLVGQNMEYQNAYIDLFFCDIQETDHWHAMTVPFFVNVQNGVFTTDNRQLKEGVDYTFAEHNSENRAAGGRGWQMLRSGELVPGNFYCFSGNGDIQTFRFKQASGHSRFFGNEKTLKAYATATTTKGDKGWNAVGNPTLHHGTVDFMVQTLEPTYTYAVHQAKSTVFPVGIAFFIQADEDGTMIMNEEAVPNRLRAKEEQRQQDLSMCIRLSDSTYTDKLYVSASEEALDVYEIGKDLVKMAMTNAPCVPQISAPYYNSNMCAVYCPFTNDEVQVPLTLYAPGAGQYALSVQCDDDVDAYLVQNNTLIWNLSAGAYDIDLAKGNTQGYKVVIRPKQQTPTDVQTNPINQDMVEKVILNQHLYVLKNGRVYDATGKLIR